MKCPLCKKEVKNIALHIKKSNPKTYLGFKETQPDLFRLLEEMIVRDDQRRASNDIKVLQLHYQGKDHYFRFKCKKCGKCCRQYDVEICEDDVKKWKTLGKTEFLYAIQMQPESISMGNLELFQRLGDESIQNFNLHKYMTTHTHKPQDTDEKNIFNTIIQIRDMITTSYIKKGSSKALPSPIRQKFLDLIRFISEEHKYVGEPRMDRGGNHILGIFHLPHWLFPDIGYRAILIPTKFNIILEGLKRGIRYKLINERQDRCEFLEKNRCSIHDIKPKACKEFPFNRNIGSQNETERLLKTCKGLTTSFHNNKK